MARYIDAEDFLDLFYVASIGQDKEFIKTVEMVIADTPTADVVEVKHGEWVYDHWCEFKCSICGHYSNTNPRGQENFCPNCGADMRGVATND